jgi:DNA replication protein DnaC
MMGKNKDLPPTTLDELKRNLERLRLFAMLEHLEQAIDQANSLEQGYVTFLAGLIIKQVLANTDASAQRRIKNALFPRTKTFDSFDWQFQKGLNVQLVKDLMNLQFIRQARPVLILGLLGAIRFHLQAAARLVRLLG